MTEYVCPNCSTVIELTLHFRQESGEPPPVLTEVATPPILYAFCFDCGEWVDFEKEKQNR